MWDLIVSVPDHCLSFYFGFKPVLCQSKNISNYQELIQSDPISNTLHITHTTIQYQGDWNESS